MERYGQPTPLGTALADLRGRASSETHGQKQSPSDSTLKTDAPICETCWEQHYCGDCHDQRFGVQGGRAVPCPRCSVSGFAKAETPGVTSEFARMRIPTKYRDCTVGNWQPAEGQPRRRAEEFLHTWPPAQPMFLMSGTVGNGKTHLACAVLRAAFEIHGKRGQFWPTIELLNRYRASFNDDTATETAEQIDAIMNRVELLVLDDFGTENAGAGFAAEKLFQLVNHRYSENLPLLITSNVGLNDLPERVRSRMKSGVMAYFDGADRRSELKR